MPLDTFSCQNYNASRSAITHSVADGGTKMELALLTTLVGSLAALVVSAGVVITLFRSF